MNHATTADSPAPAPPNTSKRPLPSLEQALAVRTGSVVDVRSRSPGVSDEWLPEIERICRGFGERPAGTPCPEAIFAVPFDAEQVAVVQVADETPPTVGSPEPALLFYFLILHREVYRHVPDPFDLVRRFPRPTRADVTLSWVGELPRPRQVAELRAILEHGEGPFLLGAVQLLVDGGYLAIVRPQPDAAIVHALWQLLPSASQAEIWPATFAFGNALGFHLLVVPQLDRQLPEFTAVHDEESVRDYPEGRYELSLQSAVEAGDQRWLDALLARRSSQQTLRLVGVLLVGVLVLALVSRALQ
jgi:hypothetical protein